MGKPKAPATPDYAAAAKEQGTANVNAAIATNYLNQANQVGPDGSLTYTYSKPGSGLGYTTSEGQYIPQVTATTTLSPGQQKLYDQNNLISTNLNDLAIRGIGYVDEATQNPIDQSKLPSLATGLAVPQYSGNIADAGSIQSQVNNPAMKAGTIGLTSSVDPTKFQSGYDFSNVSAAPQLSDFTTQRDKITDAMMQRLQPYLDRRRDAMNTQLANQGITHGSEAWNWDQDAFNRSENDQRIAALLAGDQEQQNLFNNAMGLRQQGVNEAMAQGNIFNTAATNTFNQGLANANLGNSAQGQEFNQNLSAQGQQFDQNMAAMQAANAAQSQQFSQNQAVQQAANQAQEAQFNTGLAGAQFQNQARQQAIQEADYFKNQPLNMLNALRTGNQVSMPNFGNVTAGAQIGATPVYQATADQYQAALDAYKTKMASYSGLLGGLGSLGGAAIGKWG